MIFASFLNGGESPAAISALRRPNPYAAWKPVRHAYVIEERRNDARVVSVGVVSRRPDPAAHELRHASQSRLEEDHHVRLRWLFAPYPLDDAPTRLGTVLGGACLGLGLISPVAAALPPLLLDDMGIWFLRWMGYWALFWWAIPYLLFCLRPSLVGGLFGRILRVQLPRFLPSDVPWRLLELNMAWCGFLIALVLWFLRLASGVSSALHVWGWIALIACAALAIFPLIVVDLRAWRVLRGERHL